MGARGFLLWGLAVSNDDLRSEPWRAKLENNILHAQAFGTWLYLQVGEYGLFLGRKCRRGLRIAWNGRYPRFALVRHRP